jgi:hypothetical protein
MEVVLIKKERRQYREPPALAGGDWRRAGFK